MRIDDTLGAARGARGVAHAAGRVFIDFNTFEVISRSTDEAFIVLVPLRHRLACQRHHNDALEVDILGKLRQQRQQNIVDDQETVLGVVDDERNVVREQAQVEVVHHRAGRRNAEVALEVGVMVPHQGCDPVTGLDAGLDQRLGQTLGPTVEVGVGMAMQGLVGHPRYDLHLRVVQLGPLQEMIERERHLHHGRFHIQLSTPKKLSLQTQRKTRNQLPTPDGVTADFALRLARPMPPREETASKTYAPPAHPGPVARMVGTTAPSS